MPSTATGRYPLLDALPPELARRLDGSVWDHLRMRRLKLPIATIAVEQLRWHLDLPFWRHGEEVFAVCPTEVRDAPQAFPDQHRRTWAADLRYPLIALAAPRGPAILDGLHRLCKADMLGHHSVQVGLLPVDRLGEIFVDSGYAVASAP